MTRTAGHTPTNPPTHQPDGLRTPVRSPRDRAAGPARIRFEKTNDHTPTPRRAQRRRDTRIITQGKGRHHDEVSHGMPPDSRPGLRYTHGTRYHAYAELYRVSYLDHLAGQKVE